MTAVPEGFRLPSDLWDAAGCQHVMPDGQQCGAQLQFGRGADGKCMWHSGDPEMKALARQFKSAGGRKSGSRTRLDPERVPTAPATLDDAVSWSAWVARVTALGHLDPKQAAEVTKAISQFVAALKVRDHEGRLVALEARLREMKRERSGGR